MQQSSFDANNEIFERVNDFFKGVNKAEKFNFKYFNSDLIKHIKNGVLNEINFDIEPVFHVLLTKYNINQELNNTG